MIAIKKELRGRLITWLDRARNIYESNRPELDALIAELENAEAAADTALLKDPHAVAVNILRGTIAKPLGYERADADPRVLVAVWEREGAEYKMRVDCTVVPWEHHGPELFINKPDEYVAVEERHGPPTRWEMIPESEYAKRRASEGTSGDACEFFATEATA